MIKEGGGFRKSLLDGQFLRPHILAATELENQCSMTQSLLYDFDPTVLYFDIHRDAKQK